MTLLVVWSAVALLCSSAAASKPGPKRSKGDHQADVRSNERSPDSTHKGPTALVVKTGKVHVVRGVHGGEPQLTDERGERYLLVGPWRAELLRVGGHTIKLWGTFARKKLLQRTIKVTRYQLIESAGRKPWVGMLALDATGGLLLRQPDRTLLVTPPGGLAKKLRARVGCKIWMVGELVGDAIRPSQFGWLRCKPPEPVKPDSVPPQNSRPRVK